MVVKTAYYAPSSGRLLSHSHQHDRRAGASAGGGRARWLRALPSLLLLGVAAWAVLGVAYVGWTRAAGSLPLLGGARGAPRLPGYLLAPVLVSYAYYEKDALQLANFEYFLAVGSHYPALHADMHWVFVVAGERCSPCAGLYGVVPQREATDLSSLGIKDARFSAKFTLLVRTENAGMDLGSHNVTLEWLSWRGQLARYSYFIFLNSSVKGPFLPSWTPPYWHWTAAFIAAFQQPPDALGLMGGDPRAAAFPGYQQGAFAAAAPPIHAVGASLVCLPPDDAGGPGPRLESWAFALDQEGLAAAISAGVFIMRGCKLCPDKDDGVVVGGEYGLTLAMFNAGFNIATLLSRYQRGIDWSDSRHWSCNDNVHPSRAGLYDGVSQHPFETVFVKASWHVAEPYTKRYSTWALQHLLGKAGTEGAYNRRLYRYGISDAAQHPRDLEAAYRPQLD